MVVIKNNSCRICPKVFCCSDCRDNHENSKHPKPQCSLCVKQALPLKVASEEDSLKRSELLCHIVFNHLPLRCKLCGDRFRSNADLVEAQPCRWWSQRRRKGSKTGIKDAEEAVDAEKKLPLTPQILQSSEANKSLRSIDTSSIIRLKQETFDSPPELVRHTSTPVHHPAVALPGQKLQPGISGVIPQFSLKTPCSFEKRDSSSGTASSSSTLESRYYTGISQLLSAGKNNSDFDRGNQSEVDPSWNSPTYSILKKQLEPLNVMKPEGLDSIEKRVRFSDQCLVPTSVVTSVVTTACETSAYLAENDIFFEARESLEDDEPDNNNNNNDDVKKELAVKADLAAKEEKSQTSEACTCCHRQANDISVEKKLDSSLETSANKSSSSSRVVMMLLVEKTDSSKSLSSLDLGPLIDSGLKKLEESATSKLSIEVEEKESKMKAFVKEHDFFGCAAEKPIESKIEELSSLKDVSSSSSSSGSSSSHGIFSAMARVVRSALKRLPAVGSAASTSSSSSRNLSREPPTPGACSTASGVTSTSSLSIASTAEVVTVGSTRSTTTASQIVLQRSASKRPRDRIDSGEEQSQPPPRDSGGNSSGSPRQEVVSSPAAKRHRGWYRIRAREPIARMRERQLVPQSPRGVSRETQRFQQGSLTIGDTFLPLPSRAHQSTQTED